MLIIMESKINLNHRLFKRNWFFKTCTIHNENIKTLKRTDYKEEKITSPFFS